MELPREIRTARLLLRRWKESDLDPFAKMNADPRVMEFFPGTLSREESDAGAARNRAHFEAHGFGVWVVEVPDAASFIGMADLLNPRFEAPFTPCVEIGWPLAFEHWVHGFATGAARSVLAF